MSRHLRTLTALVLSSALVALFVTTGDCAKGIWTDPEADTLPVDFQIQGEYDGATKDGDKLGCQVIALGDGGFHAVVYPGGLPGDGWDGKHKILLQGKLDGKKAQFEPADGKRKYLAKSVGDFSATRQFPPDGHKPYTAASDGQTFSGKTDDGKAFELKKIIRQSATLGAEPPKSAKVLFDGTKESMKNWRGGRLDEKTGLLNTDGRDILTAEKFNDYKVHVEFLLPYKPAARGQGRGNSGFYQVDHYEVQILDSFGLEGLHNECGGIYSKQASRVNMCLPPLVWQTYDIDFTNAKTDDSGKKIKNARVTVRLNGVVIHDDYEIPGKTGGARRDPEGTPGPLKLQGHGNPLQFRNIWIVEKK